MRFATIDGGRSFQVFRGFVDVDRFFSKLDLRDIKIDPFKTSYPPDAEEEDVSSEPVMIDQAPTSARRPHTPAWAAAAAPQVNGYVVDSGYANGYDEEEDDDNIGNLVDPRAEAVAPQERRNGDVLKVSARSRPSAVAGAIAGVVRENGRAEVQAIGAGATNQAVKAVAIARDYLRETGIEAVCLPAFIDVTIENEDRTAIRLVVEPR